MTRKWLSVLLMTIPVFLGCIPLTHMSTAPVREPGHVEFTTGVNTLSGDGSGSAFNMGARVGVAPRVDMGVTIDALSYNLDIKVHAITDEMANFDLSGSIGAGTSVLAVYRYWNLIISKTFERWTPYFAYRNTYINNDDDKSDPGDDRDPLEDAIYDIITTATANLNQFFVGAEYAISKKTYFIMEGMFLTNGDDSNLTAINAGFKFKF